MEIKNRNLRRQAKARRPTVTKRFDRFKRDEVTWRDQWWCYQNLMAKTTGGTQSEGAQLVCGWPIGSLRKDTSRREASMATQSDNDGGVR